MMLGLDLPTSGANEANDFLVGISIDGSRLTTPIGSSRNSAVKKNYDREGADGRGCAGSEPSREKSSYVQSVLLPHRPRACAGQPWTASVSTPGDDGWQ
ncbi:hypothetical protein GCT13_38160 [Paraburkholderia sp. CNPSo 3157]|uniref:Uncharacterized protein n=1 Tax=Paraburkholderia franconis TaxID=2654983 RepID=A0A7X1NJ42_9BURK|nr:hypothetical protein [Paraburkholderia franconis]MPW22493.1 hypothetical protein [Paraburkholderia franconis]